MTRRETRKKGESVEAWVLEDIGQIVFEGESFKASAEDDGEEANSAEHRRFYLKRRRFYLSGRVFYFLVY